MMKRRNVFMPYTSTGTFRFYLQRPSGYMSSYRFRSALRSNRMCFKVRGYCDPLYVSVLGFAPFRVPTFQGPVRPRKVQFSATAKSGNRCTQMTVSPVCQWHDPHVRAAHEG